MSNDSCKDLNGSMIKLTENEVFVLFNQTYIYIYIYNPKGVGVSNLSAHCQCLSTYRYLRLKINQHSTCRAKKSFYIKIKLKIHFLGAIINLFLVMMTIIRCCRKKSYLALLYCFWKFFSCYIWWWSSWPEINLLWHQRSEFFSLYIYIYIYNLK